MSRINKLIEQIEAKEKHRIIKSFIIAFPVLLLVFGALHWNQHLRTDSTINKEYLVGSLINVHQKQDITGSTFSKFLVKLDNKEVIVSPPEHTPFIKDREVNIIKNTTESGRVYYVFNGYVK